MNQKTGMPGGGQGPDARARERKEPFDATAALAQAALVAGPDSGAVPALEKTKASLALAYLNSNLNLERVPLKAFLDGCEKKILLACLRLTQGSQKKAAVLLGIKPTALFEKLRKHGIRCQRGVYPGHIRGPIAADGNN